MATSRPTDAAIKTRIITHMNADHASSLSLYLRHYCGVPSSQSKPATLTDITLEHMIIKSPAGQNFIPIKPPMKSLSEARERMVSMHQASLQGLNLSDIKVAEYAPPNKPWQWALTFLCLWCFPTFALRRYITPETGGLIYYGWSLGGLWPGLAKTAYFAAPYSLTFMLVAHFIEASYMAMTKLKRHQVEPGSAVWWAWTGNTFLSGVGTMSRFDDLVALKERKAKSEKH